jgi:hypothetical protein
LRNSREPDTDGEQASNDPIQPKPEKLLGGVLLLRVLTLAECHPLFKRSGF